MLAVYTSALFASIIFSCQSDHHQNSIHHAAGQVNYPAQQSIDRMIDADAVYLNYPRCYVFLIVCVFFVDICIQYVTTCIYNNHVQCTDISYDLLLDCCIFSSHCRNYECCRLSMCYVIPASGIWTV